MASHASPGAPPKGGPERFHTLISAAALAALDSTRLRLFDCRFDLNDAAAGAAEFRAGHIPGAVHLHLDRDLSGPVKPGKTGRHPLPAHGAFRALLRTHGVAEDTQVVAYDGSGGLFAARLWWLARWAGHGQAAVLDGGYQAWLAWQEAAKRSASPGDAERPDGGFPAFGAPPPPATMQAVRERAAAGAWTLLDARLPERFRGQNETLDAIAGHIPGAINAPFQDALAADGRFLDRATLRAQFERLLAGAGGRPVICYCGSGVSAAHNVLAMVHAGLDEPVLYPGSWSEWITDPTNPVTR